MYMGRCGDVLYMRWVYILYSGYGKKYIFNKVREKYKNFSIINIMEYVIIPQKVALNCVLLFN